MTPTVEIIDNVAGNIERITLTQEQVQQLWDDHAALRAALEQIDTEVTGALNNAFPDDAPDILAHVGGIARAALVGRCRSCDGTGIVRSLGRDNDEIIESCQECAALAAGGAK